MGLEAATFIHELVATNPVGATDPKAQGDDHIRLIKSALQNTFANVDGAVTASHTELNRVTGVTAPIEEMRGMAYSSQAAPYSVAAGDIGKFLDISSAGTVTLPNLANNFACTIGAYGGALTIQSSSGTLEWFSGSGVALPTGNRSVARGGVFTVHRVGGNWRIWGGGIS